MPPALVLVTVGSDHHPFDRLVRWVDEWAAGQPAGSVHCIVQYGTSVPPTVAEGRAFVTHDELQKLMCEAAVVVTQGGPMSIVEARAAGSVPVAVPRLAARGEHVDDHQGAFCRRLAEEGLVRTPSDQAALRPAARRRAGEPVGVRRGRRRRDRRPGTSQRRALCHAGRPGRGARR